MADATGGQSMAPPVSLRVTEQAKPSMGGWVSSSLIKRASMCQLVGETERCISLRAVAPKGLRQNLAPNMCLS